MEGARRRFLGNGNYQQGTAIIIKMFWWRNANLCEWNVNERKLVRKRTGLGNSNYQQGTAIKKKILVEEREFMRMERDCEADEHL